MKTRTCFVSNSSSSSFIVSMRRSEDIDDYGAEDVIDQLRSVLPDFHVLKSEKE